MISFGKLLIFSGILLVVLGLFLSFGSRLPFGLGRLPGDITIQRENFTFSFPIVTCLLLSIVLSLLFNFFFRR
ncbi:MAG: hypothetical protein COV76_01760 [Candidatus Omnitrophica bacterium CG11_big_fil_rev_8_21_14_0_20_64_10]|nr:MAG: hypothetical protein COV76_01760 [Candidatus Omnitrophica bacterium CG11_big_fil_rev_8_21_14_0_20_64_10]